MSIAVTSIQPIVSAQGVTSDIAFLPGSVINARVVSLASDNQVRIAIGNSTIDVQTQVPLQAGQTLQLSVSQGDDGGVRLAVVTPQTNAGTSAAGASLDDVTLAPAASADLAAALAASKPQLASLQSAAVSAAAQTAVTQQASLATLFANLGAVTSLEGLPPKLQQAIAQVLAQRSPLDSKLTGEEVKSAFQTSGLFLEATLAQGSLPQVSRTSGALPDLKAALIVLRQALVATLGDVKSGAPAAAGQGVAAPATMPSATIVTTGQPQPQSNAAGTTPVPVSSTETTAASGTLQQAAPAIAEEAPVSTTPAALTAAFAKGTQETSRTSFNGAALGAQQDAMRTMLEAAATGTSSAPDEAALMDWLLASKPQAASRNGDGLIARTNIPPPPLRGGLPTAQPMQLPTLPANAPLSVTAHHLLADTDAALARQTLLQVASLPDRSDGLSPRLDQVSPRWSFEIPFAVPAGTAMAQFEISRDGGNNSEAEGQQRVWRARFSLDIEPAGPVHALVSLTGDKTSVRMWAERPATAQQLQAGTAQLSQALIKAKLQPGDIVVREGAPVQAAPASAGHFLDRAL